MQDWWDGIKSYISAAVADAGLKLVGAIVLLVIGLLVIRWVKRLLRRVGKSGRVDKSLHGFLASAVSIVLNILLVFVIAMYLGVPSASLLAVLGSVGLAVGLALQGSLANFAGGVMILMFKPFRVGDYIMTKSGYEGVVEEITVFYTRLVSRSGKKELLPNGELSNGGITNLTANGRLRLALEYAVHYNTESALAKQVILDAVKDLPELEKDPAPAVALTALGDSAQTFTLFAWVRPDDYFVVSGRLNELVKAALDKAGVAIPYPQVDVHIDR